MKVNLDELNVRVEQRLIRVQQRATEDLYIYNYTPLAQFSRAWDEYTLMCRGLILDGTSTVRTELTTGTATERCRSHCGIRPAVALPAPLRGGRRAGGGRMAGACPSA